MIFAHTLDHVLAGTKVQTRRLVKPNEVLLNDANMPSRVVAGNRTVYQVGKTYAVQPQRGKKSVARILLTNICCEQVNQISEIDAVAEGFANKEAFLDTWQKIHGKRNALEQLVWVLQFELHAILADELRTLYEHRKAAYRSANYSDDIPLAIEGVSGACLYSRHNETKRMGTIVSH